MDLSIIIVNYNGVKYLNNCLNSIYKNLSNISFEIIIIDNNSSDDSIEFIKKNYPEIILIENKENSGFSRANNLASKKAKGKYLLFLNNDTILQSSLEKEINILNQNQFIGALSIQMLNKDKQYACSTGFFPHYSNIYRLKNLYHPQDKNLNKDQIFYVDWVEGSFMIIPKNIWVQINGFSEDYFMYAEDIDICKKIKNLGYKVTFYPKSTYIHFGGFNSSRNNQLINSLKIYCKKNMQKKEAWLCEKLLSLNLFIKKIKNKR